MPRTLQPTVFKPGLKTNLRRFWQRVTEGMEVKQLWSQFQKDARSSYQLYSAGLAEAAEGKGFHRWWGISKALFWAIIEKLSPARRVLLLLGLVLLFFPAAGFTYTGQSGDVHVSEIDLHVWGGLLIFLVLLLELADRVVLKRDLEIAKDIQNWLLPGAPLQLPGYQIAYATRPANTVAGDYYDVILRPGQASCDDRILFVVADVAGKSIPAAMLMATFQASLRTLSSSRMSLAELIVSLNRYACSNSQGGSRFTTAFLAELDPATGDLAYVNGGHNAPILRRQSGVVERLEAGGIPLGIFEDARYQVERKRLCAGDYLAIFTDGVVEAINSKGDEYGESELVRLVDRRAVAVPAELLRGLLEELNTFVGNTPQHDDMTCLLLKRAA
jgi:phosphoserine phosphatase RsbU/P